MANRDASQPARNLTLQERGGGLAREWGRGRGGKPAGQGFLGSKDLGLRLTGLAFPGVRHLLLFWLCLLAS